MVTQGARPRERNELLHHVIRKVRSETDKASLNSVADAVDAVRLPDVHKLPGGENADNARPCKRGIPIVSFANDDLFQSIKHSQLRGFVLGREITGIFMESGFHNKRECLA